MPDPRALIFDFDGVLVDSEPAHARAMGLALERMGLRFDPRHYDGWHIFIGRGDRECIIELAAESGRTLSEEELERAVGFKAEAFQLSEVQRLITPIKASVTLLRAVAARMPIAVCSGSVRDTVVRGLQRLGVAPLLRAIVTCDDVPRNKPHPDPYLEATRRLRIAPEHAIAIEDSPTGIASARAAGLYVIGVAHSFPRERLHEAHEVHDSSAAIDLARWPSR